MPKSTKKSYLLWVDIVRIIAIYLVVVVHTSILPKNPLDFTSSWPFLFSFALIKTCVPLFVLLSGALLLGKSETYVSFFKKRALKVLIPWILWTFIYMGWSYFKNAYQPANIHQWKYFFEVTFLSNLWFLPLIFSLYLLTPILRYLIPYIKKVDKIYISLLWFLFVCVLPYFHTGTSFPLSQTAGLVPVAFYYSGYFMMGYFLTSTKLPQKMVRRSLGIVLIGLSFTFLEFALTRGTGMVEHQLKFFDYFAPGIAITSIGVFLFLYSYFSKFKVNKLMQKIIMQLGGASLGIYIMHALIGDLIGPFINHLLPAGVFALVLFTTSFVVVLFLKKIPYLKMLVP